MSKQIKEKRIKGCDHEFIGDPNNSAIWGRDIIYCRKCNMDKEKLEKQEKIIKAWAIISGDFQPLYPLYHTEIEAHKARNQYNLNLKVVPCEITLAQNPLTKQNKKPKEAK